MRDTTPIVSGILGKDAQKPLEIYDVYLDSETLHYTAYDRDISFFDPDGNAQTYSALGISRGPIQTTVENTVDTCTVRLENVNLGMSSYIANNDFRGRKITIRKIFTDVSGSWAADDDIYMFKGIMSKPALGEGVLEMGCVSRAGTFELECPKRTYSLLCPWKFAASGCIDGDMTDTQLYAAQNGTIGAGSTASVISDTSRSEANNYWKYGEVEFTSGSNEDAKRNVSTSTQSISFSIDEALDYVPVSGNTYTIKRGCDKTITRCSGLSNSSAFGGFYSIPNEMIIRNT